MKTFLLSIQLFAFCILFIITFQFNAEACAGITKYLQRPTTSSIGATAFASALTEETCAAACTLDSTCLSYQLDTSPGASAFCWHQKASLDSVRNIRTIVEKIKYCDTSNTFACNTKYVQNTTDISIDATPIKSLSTEAACAAACTIDSTCFSYQLDTNPKTMAFCWHQKASLSANRTDPNIVEKIKYCDNPVAGQKNFCARLPCGEGNKCTLIYKDYECDCYAGFIPDGTRRCKDIDECTNNPCQNNGLCRNLINQFDCICPPTHYGASCQYIKTQSINNMYSMIKPKRLDKYQFSISGGSILSIYGENLILFECSGAYLIPDMNVLEATALYAYIIKNKTLNNNETIHLIIPFSGNNSANIFTYFSVILDYDGYNISLPTNQKFQYIPDPIINDMNPRTPLIFGNVSLIVIGRNLLGVKPAMIYHVKARFLNQSIFGSLKTQCLVLNDNTFKCPFEGFNNFPEGFKNESNIALGLQFEVIVSYDMGYCVNYSDGNGFLENPVFSKMGLSLRKPSFSEYSEKEVYFVPGENLKIKGIDLNVGASQFDYIVNVGLGICSMKLLLNEHLECLPPQEKPQRSNQTSTFCRQPDAYELKISLMKDINNSYIMYCVVYEDKFPMLAIIGIVAAGVLLFIAVIFICYILFTKRAKKNSKSNKFVEIINAITKQHSKSKGEGDAKRYIKPTNNVDDTNLSAIENDTENYVNESDIIHQNENVEEENEEYLNALEVVRPNNDKFIKDSFSHVLGQMTNKKFQLQREKN